MMRQQHTAFELASIERDAYVKLGRLGATGKFADRIVDEILDDVDSYRHCIAKTEADGHPAAILTLLRDKIKAHLELEAKGAAR